MEKRDSLAVGADARSFVNQPNAQSAAPTERAVEVVDGEAHVMDSLAALREELSDWRVGRLGLEQLDQRAAGNEPDDASTVRIGERDFGHSEHVTVEGNTLGQSVHGDADVGDRCASDLGRRLFHVIKLLSIETAGVATEW